MMSCFEDVKPQHEQAERDWSAFVSDGGQRFFFLLTRVFFLINVQNASCTCELFSVRQLQSAGQENPVAATQPELRTQDQ